RKSRAYNPILLHRLRANSRVIGAVHDDLVEASRLDQPVSLSAEWLLDNAYIIEGQILEVKRSLSRAFYRELPVVEAPPLSPVTKKKSSASTREGEESTIVLPRVYD